MFSGKCDYHVHYHLDGCANDEMTLTNIEKEAVRLGLAEICVLKHFSRELPNNEDTWVYWKKIIPEHFSYFLKEIQKYKSSAHIPMLAGVETELIDDTGNINIPVEEADNLDMVSLSVHWLPRMETLTADPALNPWEPEKSPSEVLSKWQEHVRKCDTAAVIENLISAFRHALEENPKVLVLAHLGDGLDPLRTYGIPVDELSDDRLNTLVQPLMEECVRKNVLWELTPSPVTRPSILMKANALGVHFTATADAHFLHADGWAHLRDHIKAEEYISSLGLTKGTIKRK